MARGHTYQQVAGEDGREATAASTGTPLVGYSVTAGADAPSAHEPSRSMQEAFSLDDEGEDSEYYSDNEETVGHVAGRGGRGDVPRYEQLRPRDDDHPLAGYDADDDIYADSESQAGTSTSAAAAAGPSMREQPAPYTPPKQSAGLMANDGVFANIAVAGDSKQADGEEKQAEMPPPYEEVAQDTAPPYFDTTVITAGEDGDELLVEGMPAGSAFSFFWSMLVSMSFQFVGFLLTYLLHTSHAGKNGSRAGLGVTLIQYGMYMRSKEFREQELEYYQSVSAADAQAELEAQTNKNVWLSYFLMILGWFIVVRSTGEYIRIRRMLAVYLYSPEGQV